VGFTDQKLEIRNVTMRPMQVLKMFPITKRLASSTVALQDHGLFFKKQLQIIGVKRGPGTP
jgi:hypothetical protein